MGEPSRLIPFNLIFSTNPIFYDPNFRNMNKEIRRLAGIIVGRGWPEALKAIEALRECLRQRKECEETALTEQWLLCHKWKDEGSDDCPNYYTYRNALALIETPNGFRVAGTGIRIQTVAKLYDLMELAGMTD